MTKKIGFTMPYSRKYARKIKKARKIIKQIADIRKPDYIQMSMTDPDAGVEIYEGLDPNRNVSNREIRKIKKYEKTVGQINELDNKAERARGHGKRVIEVGYPSPLNQNDSIAASKAWDTMKSGYMNRSQFTPEYNKKEYDSEKHEFYYDIHKNKMSYVPTDDGEVPIKGFKENLKKWQLPPAEVYNMTPNVSDEEATKVRAKFDKTYMKGNR
jgi:hypothetical protein